MRDRQNRVFVRVGTLKQSTLKKRYKLKVKKKILFYLTYRQIQTELPGASVNLLRMVEPLHLRHHTSRHCLPHHLQSVMYNRFVFQGFTTSKSFNKSFTNFKIFFPKHLPNFDPKKKYNKNTYLLVYLSFFPFG